MSALWLILAFVAGWIACWKLSSFLLKHILRKGNALMVDSLSGLPHDSLLKVQDAVNVELAKRRS